MLCGRGENMELAMRNKVIEIAQRAEEQGLCRFRSGNFSILDKENNCFYITPSGADRKTMKPEDIPVMGLDGNLLQAGAHGKPSIETDMHRLCYLSRPDIGAIVHTHSHYATVFAIKGMPIQPVADEAIFYGKKAAFANYAPPGTPELAQYVSEALTSCDVVLLRNHGVLTAGKDIEEAFLKAMYVEHVAKLYFHTLLLENL